MRQQEDRQTDLREKVLSRIERERVTPESKALCRCRRYGLWALWVLTILIGAEAVAAILFSTSSVGWEFYEATHENLLTFASEALPYLWLVLLIGMVVLSYYNFRQTKGGYRYPLSLVAALSMGGSVVGGVLLYLGGAGYVAEEFIDRTIPMYRSTMDFKRSAWMQPDRGLYGGELVSDSSEREVDGVVTIIGSNGATYSFQTTYLLTDADVAAGDRVHIIAVPTTTTSHIIACGLFEWIHERQNDLASMLKRREGFITGIQGRADTSERNTGEGRTNPCRELTFLSPAS